MASLANAAYNWKGNIDISINNAGVLSAGNFDTTPMEIHKRVIATNLLGYMNGKHAVLPFFKRQKKGVLINNITSRINSEHYRNGDEAIFPHADPILEMYSIQ